MRPNTLAVATRQRKHLDTQKFISEALHAWRSKARCNIVPAERLHELFEELEFNPTEKQINEMLQTAKLFARRGNNGIDIRGTTLVNRQMNGLTFGEFCVLAADLKRFRTQSQYSVPLSQKDGFNVFPNQNSSTSSSTPSSSSSSTATTTTIASTSNHHNKDELKPVDSNAAPEVFLGGSCNPTTWRADVAIPTLDKLGISFYNPQVSDWTPDLIELEHRAKEKARVLFFVMDSETRASAASIEVAYIAGQNARHLVLVLHPYKPDQCISNEPLSPQEYLDLKRNQQLLRELVVRRGVPVLDDVFSGLQQTRAILTGGNCFSMPQNIASRLIAIRTAFDRVYSETTSELTTGRISLQQCKCALNFLGFAQHLLQIENLTEIVKSHRDLSQTNNRTLISTDISIDFEEFCIITSYLTILQEEISESGCVSPIKGTNLPPPPIFLTNAPEWLHSASKIVLEEKTTVKTVINDTYRNLRDSGTSSPINPESSSETAILQSRYYKLTRKDGSQTTLSSVTSIVKSESNFSQQSNVNDETEEELSDSNDSVFSSGSSIDSILNSQDHLLNDDTESFDLRDIYLGGSCALRTSWRSEVIPLLEQQNMTYHMPQLHESLQNGELHDIILSSSPPCGNESTPSSTKTIETSSSNDSGIGTGSSKSGYRSQNNSNRRLFNPSLLESSRVLLFVISNRTRSLAPMTLAAHCIGLGYNIVLCIQMLDDGCIIGRDQLTNAAVKDYNRGRTYLMDLAKRQEIPVFDDLKKATKCAIEKIKQCKGHNSN